MFVFEIIPHRGYFQLFIDGAWEGNYDSHNEALNEAKAIGERRYGSVAEPA